MPIASNICLSPIKVTTGVTHTLVTTCPSLPPIHTCLLLLAMLRKPSYLHFSSIFRIPLYTCSHEKVGFQGRLNTFKIYLTQGLIFFRLHYVLENTRFAWWFFLMAWPQSNLWAGVLKSSHLLLHLVRGFAHTVYSRHIFDDIKPTYAGLAMYIFGKRIV